MLPEGGEKEKVVKLVESFVKKAKGEILKQESWGIKTLAYEIKKQKTAHYEFFVLSLDAKDQPELDKTLTLTEGLLRYLFVRV